MQPAVREDIDGLAYPLLASPYYGGFRCLVVDGVARTGRLTPMGNINIQRVLGRPEFEGMDGELVLSGNYPREDWSPVHRRYCVPFEFRVFDCCRYLWAEHTTYTKRVRRIERQLEDCTELWARRFVRLTQPTRVHNPVELEVVIDQALVEGLHHIHVWRPTGLYKHGKVTDRDGRMLMIRIPTRSQLAVPGMPEYIPEKREHAANKTYGN